MYTKSLFDRLAEHELSEVHRQPLSEVVLRMRVMLDDDHKHSDNKGSNNKGSNNKDTTTTDIDTLDTENETESDSLVPSSSSGSPLWKCDGVVAVLMALLEPPEMEQVQRLA